MLEIIKVIISSMILNISIIKISEILLEEKTKVKRWKVIIFIMLNAMLMSTNHLIVNNVTKFIFSLLDFIIIVKYIYKKELGKTVILSSLYYITLLISEILSAFLLSIIFKILSLGSVDVLKNTVIITVIISILTGVIINIFKKQYKNILEKIDNNNIVVFMIIAVLIFSTLGSSFYRIELLGWELNSGYILDTIMTITMGIIGVLVIRQRVNYERIDNQYKRLAEYSEINAALLEDYSVLNHEHNNQLILIKGMIENKDEDLERYVDSLIAKKKNIKFKWIKELNNLSFQGLKSFMNYKILEMKKDKIDIKIKISKDCKDIKFEKMSSDDKDKLYSIIGVFLDNAKDAAVKCNEKIIVIDAYVDNGEMYIEIANTYNENIDLDKINDYGYSSKGTGHGTGLYMIHKSIKNNENLKVETLIENKYFIQKLKIKSI